MTHGAVDEKVDRVADEDEQVDEQGCSVAGLPAEHLQAECVFHDHRDEQDGQRELYQEEDPDHGHQHQSRRVVFPLPHPGRSAAHAHARDRLVGADPGAVRPTAAAQQALPSPSGRPDGQDQCGVENNETDARNDVDEYDAEPVIHVEVHVLVSSDERRQVVRAGRELGAVGIEQRRNHHRDVILLPESEHL